MCLVFGVLVFVARCIEVDVLGLVYVCFGVVCCLWFDVCCVVCVCCSLRVVCWLLVVVCCLWFVVYVCCFVCCLFVV